MADLPLILVVEDEKPIARFLRAALSNHDYRVAFAETGCEALLMIESQPPDLIILDLGLPDMDGVELIDAVRQWSPLPIVILSARDQEKDKVNALDRGADDYLVKPFGVGELTARLRVALRRRARSAAGADGQGGVFIAPGLRVDLESRRVFRGDEEVHLTPIEYRLLTTLITHAGKVLTHRMLLRDVWGPGHAEEVHQLRVHMANLRRKVEMDPAQPQHILTEQGVGYRLAQSAE
ncbi:MAG TPA: response regulator [Phycisphaerae bacterium]|nr:response regulator [Phycisphaerales bacterium]HRX87479.1 response regulator [Phycisphaerae bacterium]